MRGRHFAKLGNDMDTEHKILLCYCVTHWLSRAKFTEETVIFAYGNKHNDGNIYFTIESLFGNWPIWYIFFKN